MLDAGFPQLLGSTMVFQLEPDCRFVLLKLSRSYFDVEVVAFVGDFQDFGPCEAIDSESVEDG